MKRVKLSFITKERLKKISSGEVLEPKLYNGRTGKPVISGLLCPRIFGTEDEYTCACPKSSKQVGRVGTTCKECGTSFIRSDERRKRVGHINIPYPVLHPFAISILSVLFQISESKIEKIALNEEGIRMIPSDTGILIYKGLPHNASIPDQSSLHTIERGSVGLYEVIKFIDIQRTLDHQRSILTKGENEKLAKNVRFLQRCINENFRLTDLFISSLFVLPPFIRTVLRPTNSDLIVDFRNETYTAFLVKILRSKYISDPKWKNVPELIQKDIIQRESKQFYETIKRGLFDGWKGEDDTKPEKGFFDVLPGKPGRIRKHGLGHRVDFSGRTVITPGPHLTINEMGLPRYMALRLFRPWIIRYLIEKKHFSMRKARNYYVKHMKDLQNELLREVVDEVVKERVVIMNRQPSLHRMSMFCFNIRIHDGKSMFLHPMVCAPFNADFDGDQMAVHVPVSDIGLEETKRLMFPVDNLISPADGSPIIAPSHEMVIGAYDLTLLKGENTRIYYSKDRAYEAYDREQLKINETIELRTPARQGGGSRLTCVGRLLLEDKFGVEIHEPLTKSSLKKLISKAHDVIGKHALVEALDYFKTLAYAHVSKMGFSLGIDDFIVPSTREGRMTEAQTYADTLAKEASEGKISEDARVERKIRKWMETIELLQKDFIQEAGEDNPLVIMLKTGARVSMTQVSQLVVAKGMQAKSGGGIIEDPIKNCTKTKLNTFEFFVSCYGARKSMADKKMATPLSGYLARRLVSAARDIYISEKDCGYYGEGVEIQRRHAVGRTLLSGEVVEPNNSKDFVTVRSPIFCHGRNGICSKCYGLDLSKRKRVKTGSPVGVIAAQSLTEPCTQLTMRTFHTSGAAELKDSPLVIRAASPGLVFIRETTEAITSLAVDDAEYMVHKSLCNILVSNGQKVEKGEPLAVYTAKNLANEDIGGKLFLLESYYEAKQPKFHSAVIAKENGIVELRIEEEEIDNETHPVIALYIGKEKQGVVAEVPVFVHDGEGVRKGQFLSYGEANLRKYEKDISCAANAFVQRVLFLYEQDGLSPASAHIEMIFRAMTELVDVNDEEYGLFREGAVGTRKLMGVSNVSINYPSWLKVIGFGYVKEALRRAVGTFSISKGLPSERIFTGEYPLFEPVEKDDEDDV